MRILHTSDWHFGISLHGVSLICEQQHFINELTEIIKNNNIDAVIVAGDIFDSSVSNSDAISLYNEIATKICKVMSLPMLVIAGNHDGAARISSMSELLASSGLYITGKLYKNIKPVTLEDADIYSIPYFNIDEVRLLYPDTEIKTYENAMDIICGSIRENMDKNKKNIIISHSYVSGAQLSDSDRSAMIGTASMVSKDVFKGFSYVALGHLHRPQNITKNIRYSGSPIKYSFSEASYNKSVTVYDTTADETYVIDIAPLHDMKILKDTYERLISDTSPCSDYIKIEVTDKYIGLDVLDAFRSIYPNLLAVSGKSVSLDVSDMTLTVDEINNLSPTEIVNNFFAENFDYLPTKKQINLFLQELENVENRGDLS